MEIINFQEPYKDQSKTEWIVPITYTKYYTAKFNNTKAMKWLMPNQQIKLNREVKIDKWILLNLQQTGE